jgi:hypothetical protein
MPVILRLDVKGQLAFWHGGLVNARTYLHHVKRGPGRPPVNFCRGFRLLQKFQHFYLGSHTLSPVNLTAVHVPPKTRAAATFVFKSGEEIPLGTPVRI